MLRISLTKRSMSAKKMKKVRARTQEATERMLLHAADMLRQEVQRGAPKLGDYEYAKDLEIAKVTGSKTPAVALVVRSKARKLQVSELDRTVVTILPKQGTSELVKVLASFGPWPAHLLPIKIAQTDARMVAIRVSRREIDFLTKMFISSRSQIEREVKASGIPGFKIERSAKGAGSEVEDDLATTILRHEFGMGEKQSSHWRPAIKMLQKRRAILEEGFAEFMMTGKSKKLTMPETTTIDSSEVRKGARFANGLGFS